MADFVTEVYENDTTVTGINTFLNSSTAAIEFNTTGGSSDALSQLAIGNFWYYHPIRWIESVFAILGNALVIVAVSKYENLQTPTYALIANLALGDLLTGCLMPFTAWIEKMTRSIIWPYVCSAKEILYTIASFGNLLNLIMISIDRFICLTNPYMYAKYVTLTLTLTCQGVLWLATFTTYILLHALRSVGTRSAPSCLYVYLLTTSDIQAFMVYPFYVFNVIIIVNYVILAVLVWKQGKKVMSTVSATSGQNAVQARHRKLTKVTGLVVVVYLVLTVPATFVSALVGML